MPLLHVLHAAGFHRAFTRWAKPFNPILGETWQATAADGSRIYLEQVGVALGCQLPRMAGVTAVSCPGAAGRVFAGLLVGSSCDVPSFALPTTASRLVTTHPSRHSSCWARMACTPSVGRGAQGQPAAACWFGQAGRDSVAVRHGQTRKQ